MAANVRPRNHRGRLPHGDAVGAADTPPYRILSLDGGGAKGFYTLGVLKEIEAALGGALYARFDLMFGTSTGSIIAALLALGCSVDEIHALYKEHVPTIMECRTRRGRSAALAQLASSIFCDKTFVDVRTGIGIVATRWEFERPMIFKGSVAQAKSWARRYLCARIWLYDCGRRESVLFCLPVVRTSYGDNQRWQRGRTNRRWVLCKQPDAVCHRRCREGARARANELACSQCRRRCLSGAAVLALMVQALVSCAAAFAEDAQRQH